MIQIVTRRGAVAAAILSCYWMALFAGTHIPRPPEALAGGINDKALHAGAFAVLAFLLAWGCQSWFRSGRSLLLFVLIVLPTYAALDELLQGLVPPRTPDLADWVADVCGAAIGLGCYFTARLLLQSPPRIEPARERVN